MTTQVQCPGTVAPGALATVRATNVPANASYSVVDNGTDVPATLSPPDSSGNATLTFTMPECKDPPEVNIVTVTINGADCDIARAPCEDG